MRITLICMKCSQESRDSSLSLHPAILEDSGLYHMTCAAGHKTVTRVQEMKFEILFDVGVHAIIDGYHREAVVSFSSALERTYEFYLLVQCMAAGVPDAEYASSWKKVASQSERQLGAFVFAHALLSKKAPSLLQDKDVRFRNDVIHNGKIPTRDQAIDFGRRVLELVRGILAELRRDAPEQIGVAIGRHVESMHAGVTEQNVQLMSIATLVSLTRTDEQPTIEEWITHLQGQRARGFFG
jgi:hypothetical protein